MELSGKILPIPSMDAHLDLGCYVRAERAKGRTAVIKTEYEEHVKNGNVKLIIAAIYIDETSYPGSALRQAAEQIAALQREETETPDFLHICTSFSEVEETNRAGKLAILLSFEGAEPLGHSVDLLDFFYSAGLRGFGMAHARRNLACDGAKYTDYNKRTLSGLTDLGFEFLERARELHMLIDAVHLNDPGTQDVLSVVKGPLIISHANCRVLNPTSRNISDDTIRSVADYGGVIGLNGCNSLVSCVQETANAEYLVQHAKHMKQIGGTDCICLGFDIAEMILPGVCLTINGNKMPIVDVVPNYSRLGHFAELLKAGGFTMNEIEKIYSGNLSRLLQEVLN